MKIYDLASARTTNIFNGTATYNASSNSADIIMMVNNVSLNHNNLLNNLKKNYNFKGLEEQLKLNLFLSNQNISPIVKFDFVNNGNVINKFVETLQQIYWSHMYKNINKLNIEYLYIDVGHFI